MRRGGLLKVILKIPGWSKQRKQQVKGFEMGRNLMYMYSKKENVSHKQEEMCVCVCPFLIRFKW